MGETEIKINLEVGHTSGDMSRVIGPNQDTGTIWGDIFANNTLDKGLISKIYKELT